MSGAELSGGVSPQGCGPGCPPAQVDFCGRFWPGDGRAAEPVTFRPSQLHHQPQLEGFLPVCLGGSFPLCGERCP